MVICLIFFIFFFLVVVVIGPHSCPSITLCYDGYRRGWCLYLTWLEGHSWWWNNRRQFSHERVRKEQSYSQRSLLLRRFILHSLSSFLLHVIGSLQDRTRPRDRSFQAPLRKSYIANWPSGSDHVKHPKCVTRTNVGRNYQGWHILRVEKCHLLVTKIFSLPTSIYDLPCPSSFKEETSRDNPWSYSPDPLEGCRKHSEGCRKTWVHIDKAEIEPSYGPQIYGVCL